MRDTVLKEIAYGGRHMEEKDEYEGMIESKSLSPWEETKRGWANAISMILKVQVVIPAIIGAIFLYVSSLLSGITGN